MATAALAVEAPPVLKVLAEVAATGVSVALAGDGRLVVQAPPMGTVSAQVRALIAEHKDAIVADLVRRHTLGDRPALRAWLCVACQQMYPAPGPLRLCPFCLVGSGGSR